MNKNNKMTINGYTLKQLQKYRKEALKVIDVWRLQEINHLLAKLAKKYKIDYYSL